MAAAAVALSCLVLAQLALAVAHVSPRYSIVLPIVGTGIALSGLLTIRRRKPGFALLPAVAVGGVLALLWGVFAAQGWVAWGKGQLTARSECMSHMRSIGIALGAYRNDHARAFPPDLETLYARSYDPRAWWVFLCPTDRGAAKAMSALRTSYAYIGALAANVDIDGETVVAFEKKRNHCSGRSVLFVDGSVGWLTDEDLRVQLQTSLQKVKGHDWERYSEGQRRDIEAFYAFGPSP
jgi:hypothetical protein